jgi:hypothetical protein
MPMNRDRTYTPLPKSPPPKPKVKADPPRSGKSDPWAYGPYRVVAQRRVSEEEQISVECYATTATEGRQLLRDFLADFRAHMIAYNEQVVLTQQAQLSKIEQLIEDRGMEARRIEAEIAALVAQKQDIAHPDAPDVNDNEAPDADAAS